MTVNPLSAQERIDVNQKSNSRSGFTLIEGLVVLAIIGLLIAFFLPAVRTPAEAARRIQCKNNLKQIGLALLNYEETYKAFPPAYTVDADGKQLHSWRTLILPYLDQEALYNTIDLSKPWNDPANAKAHATYIQAYGCPSTTNMKSVAYMACVGSDRFLLSTTGRLRSEIKDSPKETLMVIEVEMEEPVHWMEPIDADEEWFLNFNPKTKLHHSGGIHAVFVDGHIQFINAEMPVSKRLGLLTINDGKK